MDINISDFIMSPIELFFISMVFAAILIWMVWQIIRRVKKKSWRETSIIAVLTSKYEEDYLTKEVYVGSNGIKSVKEDQIQNYRNYYLDFETQDQTHLSFLVEQEVYNRLIEGSNGVLTYKGEQFISYTEQKDFSIF